MRDQAAGSTSTLWALPVRDAGTMHTGNRSYRADASKAGDDGRSRFHPPTVAIFTTDARGFVAKLETDKDTVPGYQCSMLALWLKDALKHSGLSQVRLAAELTEKLGRSIDRAAVNKMLLTSPKLKVKPRKISADEMLAIEEITGYPLPVEHRATVEVVPVISWVSAGRMWAQEAVKAGDIVREIPVADLPNGDWIALQIEGDSMDRVAPPGSVILVNTTDTRLVPEKFYVFGYETGEATFKRYRPNPDRLVPYSTNPDHESVYPEDGLKIVGRAHRVITELE
ncbi:hypothetical protein GCM10019059_44740 [Camelimonas fluminis]|nr:hypothetical protein GCM10019059_44740 [Camelimonas fluminis]